MASDDTYTIAERYTRALFALAQEQSQLEAAEKDLQALGRILAESREFKRLLANPLLPRERKAAVLEAVLAKLSAADVTRRFIRRLALAQRLGALPAIIRQYEALMTEHRGEVVLDVASTRPLSESDAQAVAAVFERASGKRVRVRAAVDPSLLGGLVVKMGGRMIDASVRSKLSRLQAALKSRPAA